MNWNQVEGQWHTLTGQLQSRWDKLTDDDIKNVAGKREQLIGKLQERYGILRDVAEKQLDRWTAKLASSSGDKPRKGVWPN